MSQVPDLLNHNESTIKKGLIKHLSHVNVSIEVVRKNFFDCSTKLLYIPLRFLDLMGFVEFFLLVSSFGIAIG